METKDVKDCDFDNLDKTLDNRACDSMDVNDVAKEQEKTLVGLKTNEQIMPGIIYLSTIPPGMNVKMIREYFSEFGEINRSFLQPETKGWKKKLKKNQAFVEGWIEFKKRQNAKTVAKLLNNSPVGGSKRKTYHDFLWNIKYLKGFQWVHLNERLAYERISRQQKLRAEISAAKRETQFFARSVELNNKLQRKKERILKIEQSTASSL